MRRAGDIKVIGVDRMCFYVAPVTLEPRSCGCYDAWAHTHSEPPEMSSGEWSRLRADLRDGDIKEKP